MPGGTVFGGIIMICKIVAAIACAIVGATAVHAAPFVVLYETEKPGMVNTSATFSKVGVETFDNASSASSFTTNFGGSPFTGTYKSLNGSNVQINNSDSYGGAGNNGRYAVAFNSTPYSLKLDQSVDYFGFWLSALDAGNTVAFYSGDIKLFTFDADDVLNAVQHSPAASIGDYFGKPGTGVTRYDRQDASEPYIFLDFFANNGFKFNRVDFAEQPTYGGGYESDNHTVGFYKTMGTGTQVPLLASVSAVPEPATWAMMIVGVGAIGIAMRRRTAQALSAA